MKAPNRHEILQVAFAAACGALATRAYTYADHLMLQSVIDQQRELINGLDLQKCAEKGADAGSEATRDMAVTDEEKEAFQRAMEAYLRLQKNHRITPPQCPAQPPLDND